MRSSGKKKGPKVIDINNKEEILKKLKESTYTTQEDHWIYYKFLDKDGYGSVCINYRNYRVHRLSLYIFRNIDIYDDSILVLHKNKCHTRSCWNSDHLYCGSDADNNKDKSELIRCSPNYPCGHPRTPENSYNCGWCKECRKRYYREGPIKNSEEEEKQIGPRNYRK